MNVRYIYALTETKRLMSDLKKSAKGKQWMNNRQHHERTLLSSINSDLNDTEFLTWISRKTIQETT